MAEEIVRDKRGAITCIILSKPNGLPATGFNIQEFSVVSAERIYVFCMDLRTDSNFRTVQQ
jgi:hypothetical protein